MNGLVVAAPRSGSGKTTITLGILAALRQRGITVAPAKTGPDYIDTTILARAAGREAINLDPWAMGSERIQGLAREHVGDADVLVVEGVMGLFDGAADGRGSTGDLATTLSLPVILVVDAERQSQSIAALVHGFASWRRDVAVAGVIVNRAASTRHEAMLRAALAQVDVPLLGVLPRRDALVLPERHLGLVLPDEVARFDEVVRAAAAAMEDYVDLNLLLALSATPPSPLREGAGGGGGEGKLGANRTTPSPHPSPQGGGGLPPLAQRIAIARDEAFAFLYPHWLKDWQRAGAALSFFSPLADEAPDKDADAVFLPGGYPELHGARLASADRFLSGLRSSAERGALVYGECGGFMVLGTALTDKAGVTHRMSGLLPHETRIDRPKRVLGYRRLSHASPLPFPARLNGHEFHYSSARRTHGTPLFAATDALGEELPPMGLLQGRVMGSYAHVIDVA